MALSNIFREPRREITETLVGAAIVLPLLYTDYRFGLWFSAQQKYPDNFSVVLGMWLGAVGLVGIGLVAIGIHTVGEGLCNRLQAAGIHLRPRRRM